MRKKYLLLSIILIISILSICFVGCNNIGGKDNKLLLISYRHNGQFFTLPVKVLKTDAPMDSLRHFKSRMSLHEIYESVISSGSLQAKLCNNYIVIKDLSAKNLGYCIISSKKTGAFNYIARNMACFYNNNFSSPQSALVEILIPIHFIPELIEDNVLIENKEYALNATIENVISFYNENGFEVTPSQSGIRVKDNIGRISGGQPYFDEIINAFEITSRENKIAFAKI